MAAKGGGGRTLSAIASAGIMEHIGDVVDEDVASEGSDNEDEDEDDDFGGAAQKKGMVVSGEGEQAFCKGCFLESFRDRCAACDEFIEEEMGGVSACGAMWHVEHLVCAFDGCGKQFFGKKENGDDEEDGEQPRHVHATSTPRPRRVCTPRVHAACARHDLFEPI
jgi:hypothetical protein